MLYRYNSTNTDAKIGGFFFLDRYTAGSFISLAKTDGSVSAVVLARLVFESTALAERNHRVYALMMAAEASVCGCGCVCVCVCVWVCVCMSVFVSVSVSVCINIHIYTEYYHIYIYICICICICVCIYMYMYMYIYIAGACSRSTAYMRFDCEAAAEYWAVI